MVLASLLFEVEKAGHLNLLFVLGLAVLGGTVGARMFQKLNIPQVVGYIVVGILVGGAVFNIVDKELIESLRPFNLFALGI